MELNLPALTNRPRAELPQETASLANGKVARYADRINQSWRRTVDGILDVAKDCAAARRDLTPSEKQELYENLPFGKSMFSKLATIGEDARLFEHQERLPASISTLYIISNLTEEQFDSAVADGVLHPDVLRDDVEEWITTRATENKTKEVSTKTDEPKVTRIEKLQAPARLYCLIVDEMPSDEQHSEYEKELRRWAKEAGMKGHVFTGENLASEFRQYLTREAQTA